MHTEFRPAAEDDVTSVLRLLDSDLPGLLVLPHGTEAVLRAAGTATQGGPSELLSFQNLALPTDPTRDRPGLIRLAILDLHQASPDVLDVDELVATVTRARTEVLDIRTSAQSWLDERALSELIEKLLNHGVHVVFDSIEQLLGFRPAGEGKLLLRRSASDFTQLAWRRDGSVPPKDPDRSIDNEIFIGAREVAGQPTDPAASASSDVRPVRFVNTVLAQAGATTPVAADQPLLPTTDYDLLVNIGARHAASLLPESDAGWPAEQLPGGDLRLRAVLCLDGSSDPLVEPMTLPERGDSFTCSCPPDSAHEVWCTRRPWARFSFTTPGAGSLWGGELIIYYEAVAVHAQRLLLPLGDGRAGGPRATLTYRLTKSFANLGDFEGRTASILVAANHGRVIVNGLSFVDNPIAVESNAADQAARAGRDLLYDIHLNTDGTNRYSEDQRKSQAAFEADLRLLARAGAEIYERLFADDATWRTLPRVIRQEARARTLPAVLCIAEPTSVQQRGGSIPWSLVYDLAVGADPDRYELCDSVRLFGPEGSRHDIPPHCPISDHTDELDVLCPFGFWGLSCLIEQPPSADRDTVKVVTTNQIPISFLMASGSGLDTNITSRHLSTLRTRLGQALATQAIDDTATLAAALAEEAMDVAYLYCHCGYQKLSSRAVPSPFLRFGDDLIGPLDIANWARSAGWPRPHWQKRKPLVILNGCHTVEMTSGTLSTFVSAFVNRAGAAGVLGTEVAIEQDLASLLGENVLDQLAGGASVGTALRRARWKLINLGNVMGLAYTPFCLSGLRLRPPVDEEHAP